MVSNYIFDTCVFRTLDHYYPARFPTLWRRIGELINDGRIWSVREVRRELDNQSPSGFMKDWVRDNRTIFRIPSPEELQFVNELFKNPRYMSLVKWQNILKGYPSADPFVISAGKVHGATVVTQETRSTSAVRIPHVCDEQNVSCINLERFLELEGLIF